MFYFLLSQQFGESEERVKQLYLTSLIHIGRLHYPSVWKSSVLRDVVKEFNELFYVGFESMNRSLLLHEESYRQKADIDLHYSNFTLFLSQYLLTLSKSRPLSVIWLDPGTLDTTTWSLSLALVVLPTYPQTKLISEVSRSSFRIHLSR